MNGTKPRGKLVLVLLARMPVGTATPPDPGAKLTARVEVSGSKTNEPKVDAGEEPPTTAEETPLT